MDGSRDCHTESIKSDGEVSYDVSYMQNLKRNDTDELIYKTERDSDLKNTVMVAGVKDERKG